MSERRPAPPTSAQVADMLRAVIDPELGDNIVDLGMAGTPLVDAEGLVTIPIKLTIMGCPLRSQIK
ncbi:MAG: iron-sulfur cluster assembly protein [Ilumatobacteraceae bacterium]